MAASRSCDFDYGLGDGVRKTYRRLYKKHLAEALDLLTDLDDPREAAQSLLARVEAETGTVASLTMDAAFAQGVARELGSVLAAGRAQEGDAYRRGRRPTTRPRAASASAARHVASHHGLRRQRTPRPTPTARRIQAMEALDAQPEHHAFPRRRADAVLAPSTTAWTPSPEGRMVVRNMLLATEAGLGNGETPIFPIQIFRVKEGVNYNPGDPNYDLFKLAMHCSAKRLFPNFSFLDAPFNLHSITRGHTRKPRSPTWAAARA